MNSDTPSITTSCYTSSGTGLEWKSLQANSLAGDFVGAVLQNSPDFSQLNRQPKIQAEEIMPNSTRRIVQVFIADPNDNVPLEHSVLYRGDQKLTDLTDTELFFEVPMADILKSHNDKRVKFIDKEATKRSGKDVTLDPVKIRELKMVVVNVAQF